jgi:hypothetical protein
VLDNGHKNMLCDFHDVYFIFCRIYYSELQQINIIYFFVSLLRSSMYINKKKKIKFLNNTIMNSKEMVIMFSIVMTLLYKTLFSFSFVLQTERIKSSVILRIREISMYHLFFYLSRYVSTA